MEVESTLIIGGLSIIVLWLFYPNELSLSPASKNKRGYPAGLYNYGNTCYFNSVIQALSACSLKLPESPLATLIHSINTLSDTTISPPKSSNSQQDAHELYTQVTSSIPDLFGLLAYRMECETCGYAGVIRHEVFSSVTVGAGKRIEDCIDEYVGGEELKECWKCPKCCLEESRDRIRARIDVIDGLTKDKENGEHGDGMTRLYKIKRNVLTRDLERLEYSIRFDIDNPPTNVVSELAVKYTRLASLPRILVLHIQRSMYTGRGSVKCNDRVGISMRLCVDTWRTCRSDAGVSKYFSGEQGGWQCGNDSSSVDEVTRKKCMYELLAVICHYGSHENGHYICFKKVAEEWYRISDADVRRVDEARVLDEGSEYCFMMFYEGGGCTRDVRDERRGLGVLVEGLGEENETVEEESTLEQ